ncbi:8908_t:CDS:2 [Cetraspora pellucida]|uniref:8908_t:CDS:1 n=1 Tax=Cetraspora pellucida TaxID=1433469 RepID=A0A9N9E9D9_9GLOM|nr:8908_t:CDS:2 [Cetraspora pellucida]
MFIYIGSEDSNNEEVLTSYEHIQKESDTVKPGLYDVIVLVSLSM